MIIKSGAEIPFRSAAGVLVGHVVITPIKDAATVATAPLIQIDPADAQEHGETEIQLRESESYEYEVRAPGRRRLPASLQSCRTSKNDQEESTRRGAARYILLVRNVTP